MDVKVICVTALLTLVISTSGFLLDTDCPVVAPCSCWLDHIHCEYKSLTTVSVFKNTSVTLPTTWYLNFTGNSISGIRDNAFIVLETVNSAGSDIQLLLGSNNLTVSGIEAGAFNGVENMTSYVDLSNNHLTDVPVAISKLLHLKELDLDSNPIASVNLQVFISIGHTLERLNISLANVQIWPQALHHLTVLKYLKISDYKHDFQSDAFMGFRATLQQLVFHSVKLKNIPSPICGLVQLTILNITNDLDLTDRNIVHCNPALNTVHSIMFNGDNNEEYFPDLFNTFPNLYEVYITSCKTSFIDESLISTNVQLKRLTIADGQLTTIPGAIDKFTRLVFCDLHSNMIQSIEQHSLGSMRYLTRLDLRNNPIVFISKDAFPYLSALLSIDLRETRLTRIPQAVHGLTHLTIIDLRNNRIFCNCDASWLKTWASTSSAVIEGICETSNELIRNFVKINVPHCP